MGIDNILGHTLSDPYGLPEPFQAVEEKAQHPMDGPEALKLHRELMAWYTAERTKQSVNRYQMALDQDFYDGLQWDPEDVDALRERGQWPLVYNLVAPVCNWIIGTQKRTPLDWKILPRRAAGSELADVKTELMKYISDTSNEPWAISAAFKDAVIVGLGWLENGVRGDDGDEPVFAAYESWRNMLYDSSGKERDQSDWRYMFRWKWVDEDLALALFPDRKEVIEQAVRRSMDLVTGGLDESGEEFWYLGQVIGQGDPSKALSFDRRSYISDTTYLNFRRRRVRLIEGWYTVPVRKKILRGFPDLNGQSFDRENPTHLSALESGAVSLFDSMTWEMRCAVFTERAMLWMGPSPYTHNRYPFTPIWCYRRGRDNAPYGVVRGLRDPQEDYNKRASKALWMLSTNRIVMEDGAVDDIELLREEAARPDGIIVHNRGTQLEISNDIQLADAQLELMDRDNRHIQASSGVTDELMGRQTNAVSGKAIEARQLQGSVSTAEIFDNLRLAKQLHGQKLLSLCEQFISEPRVLRITGAQGQIEWLNINEPIERPDGVVEFLNDVTAEQSDFVVSEQDYHATSRAAMFEQLMETLNKLPPEIALKLLPQILELSDIPNKDEFINELRQLIGVPKPSGNMSPEEEAEYQAQQQAEQQAAEQAQALATQMAQAELAEKLASAKLKEAQAFKAQAEAAIVGDDQEQKQLELARAQQDDQFNAQDRTLDLNHKAQSQAIERQAQLQQADMTGLQSDQAMRLQQDKHAQEQRRQDELLKAKIKQSNQQAQQAKTQASTPTRPATTPNTRK